MDKIKSILAAAGFILLTASCQSNGKFAEEIQTVDSLISIVEDFQLRLNAIDSDTVSEKLSVVSDRVGFLMKNYQDSTDRKFWISDMNYLGSVEKAYSRFEENNQTIGRQLEESMKQLTTLKNSLVDEKLTPEEAREYVDDEAHVVMQIKFSAQKMIGRVEEADVVWDSLQPYFDSIAISLRGAQ